MLIKLSAKLLPPINLVNFTLILAVAFLYVFAIIINFINGGHLVTTDPVNISLIVTAISISEIVSEATGFTGYFEVLKTLQDQASQIYNATCEQKEQYLCVLRGIDYQAAVLTAESANGTAYLHNPKEDLGEILFHKLAYTIFGLKTDSLTKFYFLILLMSLVCYLGQFFRSRHRLFILICLLSAICFFISILPQFDSKMPTVHSRRFWSTLAFVPVLHLGFLICDGLPVNRKVQMIIAIQCITLVLLAQFRGSITYFFLFLFFVALTYSKINRFGMRRAFSLSNVYTNIFGWIAIPLVLLKLGVSTWISPVYDGERVGHLFWHPFHIGLSIHPKADDRYNIYYGGDMPSFDYVSDFAEKNYGSPKWDRYMNYDGFDDVLRDRVIHIAMTDPMFFMQSYLLKIATYFEFLVVEILTPNMTRILVVTAIVLALSLLGLAGQSRLQIRSWSVMLLLWPFTFIPPLVVLPTFAYSIDFSIMTLSMTVAVTALLFNWLFQLFIRKNKKYE